eukprot:1985588-Prymnesium_polylepis.1
MSQTPSDSGKAHWSAHASLLSVERDSQQASATGVVPFDAGRLLSVTRVQICAARGAVTQLDSQLVRQQCTMSGRTATWRQLFTARLCSL